MLVFYSSSEQEIIDTHCDDARLIPADVDIIAHDYYLLG
jgi:hypothetical protein